MILQNIPFDNFWLLPIFFFDIERPKQLLNYKSQNLTKKLMKNKIDFSNIKIDIKVDTIKWTWNVVNSHFHVCKFCSKRNTLGDLKLWIHIHNCVIWKETTVIKTIYFGILCIIFRLKLYCCWLSYNKTMYPFHIIQNYLHFSKLYYKKRIKQSMWKYIIIPVLK